MEFTIYSRPGCHLCEDMIAALETMTEGRGVTLRIVDLDQRPDLIASHALRIPVLEADGEEVCSGHLIPDRIARLLDGAR
jgi:glutaredoxin